MIQAIILIGVLLWAAFTFGIWATIGSIVLLFIVAAILVCAAADLDFRNPAPLNPAPLPLRPELSWPTGKRVVWVIIVVTLLIAGITLANITLAKAQTSPKLYDILPPVQYDYHYEGDLTIKIVDTLEELYDLCRIPNRNILACSTHNSRSCLIVMVNDELMRKRGYTTGLLFRHEQGHCNGWGPDHGGERPQPPGAMVPLYLI